MSDKNQIYIKATPQFTDLDNQEDGTRFAEYIAAECAGKAVDHIVIDLCGDVYLDYWGCSQVADQCIDLLASHEPGRRQSGRLSIITSFRNEERAEYAWLFFYKSKFLKGAKHSYELMATHAIEICKAKNVIVEVFIKDFNFSYQEYDKLGNAEVTLSSK